MFPSDFLERDARMTIPQLAVHYGVATRTINRWRKAAGLSVPSKPPMTDEQVRIALDLLAEGCPYSEVAETVGRSAHRLRRRFPGYTGTNPAEVAEMHRAWKALAA